MTTSLPEAPAASDSRRGRLHRRLTVTLQVILVLGLAAAVWEEQWLTATTTGAVIVLTLFPVLFRRRLRVFIPPEFEVHMRPRFVALFAFMFAVGLGALWEIFEFSMDAFFGMDMQKAMLGDPSGLTDTMWDLIVDSVGAAVIAALGFGYLKTQGSESFLEQWIDRFIETNPSLFRRSD